MPSLALVAEIKAKPGKEAELRGVLTGLVQPTRAEEGCLTYGLHAANDDPGFFIFYKNWQTVPLWEQHMESPHLEAFKGRTDELVADWKFHQLTKIA